MISQVFGIFVKGIPSVFSWFGDFYEAIGAHLLISSLILLFIFSRLLLSGFFSADVNNGKGSKGSSRRSKVSKTSNKKETSKK